MALTRNRSDPSGDAGFREVTGECVWVTVQTKGESVYHLEETGRERRCVCGAERDDGGRVNRRGHH